MIRACDLSKIFNMLKGDIDVLQSGMNSGSENARFFGSFGRIRTVGIGGRVQPSRLPLDLQHYSTSFPWVRSMLMNRITHIDAVYTAHAQLRTSFLRPSLSGLHKSPGRIIPRGRKGRYFCRAIQLLRRATPNSMN